MTRRDTVSVRRIWITLALSMLIHALVMWRVHPEIRTPASDEKTLRDAKGQLSVQLVPRRSAPPEPQPAPRVVPAPRPKVAEAPRPRPAPRPKLAEPAPRATPREAPPRPAVRPPPKPPVLAVEKPAAIPAPPVERAPPSTPRPPDTTDLASYIEARRRARGETPPAAPPPAPEVTARAPAQEDSNARANRIAAANLGTSAKPSFGADARRGGGIFTVQRLTYDYAEFLFYGWNKDIRRNTQQLIEVRKGNHSDIRIAVVRRMIAIIRDHEQGDFVWESPRLGRNVTLSARQRDQAGLEAFLMREFFEDDRRPPPGALGR